MKKLIVSDTIRHSRNIYTEFITGIRQNDQQSRQPIDTRRPIQGNHRYRRPPGRRVWFRSSDERRQPEAKKIDTHCAEEPPTDVPRPDERSERRAPETNSEDVTRNISPISPQPGPSGWKPQPKSQRSKDNLPNT